jgi:hypothetical protein
MNTKQTGRSRFTAAALALAGVATLGFSSTSHAGCADINWSQAAPAPGGAAESASGSFIKVADWGSPRTIVGLWKFEMVSKSTKTHQNPMPDGTLIDFGTAAWHADGTEFQTSGIRNPSDGDVCQGVWSKVGNATFVLNHYALGWTDGTYTGPANIRAQVTVSPGGNSYTGTFTTVAYMATAIKGHEFDQNTVLATITGTFSATRVTLE